MDKKKIILDFIKTQTLGVIATVDENGNPESALIGFGKTDDLTLIIGTFNTTRKYKNIQRNPNVSLVIGGWDETPTVQYEGEAIELSGKEKEELLEIYFAKNPEVKKYLSFPEERYFKIIPKWIRFTQGLQEGDEIFEIMDF